MRGGLAYLRGVWGAGYSLGLGRVASWRPGRNDLGTMISKRRRFALFDFSFTLVSISFRHCFVIVSISFPTETSLDSDSLCYRDLLSVNIPMSDGLYRPLKSFACEEHFLLPPFASSIMTSATRSVHINPWREMERGAECTTVGVRVRTKLRKCLSRRGLCG